MSRINPLPLQLANADVQQTLESHRAIYGEGVSNMASILSNSHVSLQAYLNWYPVYEEVKKITGERLAHLYAYAISASSDCSLCKTFFRKQILETGENPDKPLLTVQEKNLIEFGNSINKYRGNIANHVYDAVAKEYNAEELTVLVAFAGLMIAQNIFNNTVEVELDQTLSNFVTPVKSIWQTK